MRLLSACLMVAAVAGCGNDALSNVETGLVINPTTATVRPGDSLTIELTNLSSAPLSENLCALSLEQQRRMAWTAVYAEPGPGRACPAYAQSFLPGQIVQRSLALPTTLSAGRYRVVFLSITHSVGGPLAEEQRASAPFEVEP